MKIFGSGRTDRSAAGRKAMAHVLALLAVIYLLPATGCNCGANPPAAADTKAAVHETQAASARDAAVATKNAFMRLRGLGAEVSAKNDGRGKRWISAALGPSWKGTDSDLGLLVGLEDLKSLSISEASVTGAGLKQLAGVKHLECFELGYCPALAESNLAPLVSLGALRTLFLCCPVTAECVKNVARLDSLEVLWINFGDIKPADVAPLAHLSHLRELHVSHEALEWMFRSSNNPDDELQEARLRNVPLGDAIGRVAGEMPSLQALCVEVPMGEEGMRGLAAAGTLQSIDVNVIEVDDCSLAPVGRLQGLRKLALSGPGKRGIIDELRAAMPGVEVSWSNGTDRTGSPGSKRGPVDDETPNQ